MRKIDEVINAMTSLLASDPFVLTIKRIGRLDRVQKLDKTVEGFSVEARSYQGCLPSAGQRDYGQHHPDTAHAQRWSGNRQA